MRALGMINRIKFTPCFIFSCGILMHILFLGGVFDAYFTSPLDLDLPSYRSEVHPMAKRVVLIISDGLRAEGMLKYSASTDYLTMLRKDVGVWGVGHTQVPTESRPGHIGILAGIYEDPSAIFKGWQANTVAFDSVIKQCNNAFAWGCADIVNIFRGENVMIKAYDDPEMQDFSGKKPPRELDAWVFNQVQATLNRPNKTPCGKLCEDGNVFFLHLLGMDTVGHVFKPDSHEYLETLRAVSVGVKQMHSVFDGFFKDKKTAYVFTSDHGMTNRGSHGSGSDHETQIPVIAWGAGIARNSTRQDINQIDIAPLIAGLLGINFPINSIGRLPVKYLNGTDEQIAGALLANTQQIVEQFLKKDQYSRDSLYYMPFSGLSLVEAIFQMGNLNKDFAIKQYETVLKNGQKLMELSIKGIRYYQSINQIPTLMMITLIFLGWFGFVFVFICTVQQPHTGPKRFIFYRKCLPFAYFAMSLIAVVLYAGDVHYKYYFYIALCAVVFYMMNYQLLQNENNVHFPLETWQVVFMIAYIELLVLCFFYRELLALALMIVAIWGSLTYYNISRTLLARWNLSLGIIGMFLFFPMSHTFSYSLLLLTISAFYLICVTTLNIQKFTSGMYLFLVCSLTALITAVLFDNNYGVPLILHVLSYSYIVCAFWTVWRCGAFVMSRLRAIIIAFMAIYIQMTMSFEGLFYCVLVVLLYTWLQIELFHGTLVDPPEASWPCLAIMYFNELPRQRKAVHYEDFRRVLFYLTFILVSFFGTGNIASISSFNPTAARAFTSSFSPFLIMAVLIVKICIPFVICACTFVLVLAVGKCNIGKMLAIVMLACDIMVLNFMFLVKNEGSWQEIGMSLSHFVIAEALTLVLILLYYACLIVMRQSGADANPNLRAASWRDVGTCRFKYSQFWAYYTQCLRDNQTDENHDA